MYYFVLCLACISSMYRTWYAVSSNTLGTPYAPTTSNNADAVEVPTTTAGKRACLETSMKWCSVSLIDTGHGCRVSDATMFPFMPADVPKVTSASVPSSTVCPQCGTNKKVPVVMSHSVRTDSADRTSTMTILTLSSLFSSCLLSIHYSKDVVEAWYQH